MVELCTFELPIVSSQLEPTTVELKTLHTSESVTTESDMTDLGLTLESTIVELQIKLPLRILDLPYTFEFSSTYAIVSKVVRLRGIFLRLSTYPPIFLSVLSLPNIAN